MRPAQFLRLDFTGACLYTLAYCGLGYLFRDFLAAITRGFHTASHALGTVVLVAFVVYIVYRAWLYRKNADYRIVPRVQVHELAARLASDEELKPLVLDVRSHGYYDPNAERIKGSIRLEPNNLEEELKTYPKDKDIYLYCT